jgi:hypothetical protein
MSSDFPNMSYCRYENTRKGLEQILNDGVDEYLNEYEHRERQRLVKLCQDFLEEAENHENLIAKDWNVDEEAEDEEDDEEDDYNRDRKRCGWD